MPLVPERKPDQRDKQHDVNDDPDSLKSPTAEQGESAVTGEGRETPHEQGRIAGTAYDRDGGAQANGGPNRKAATTAADFGGQNEIKPSKAMAIQNTTNILTAVCSGFPVAVVLPIAPLYRCDGTGEQAFRAPAY